jgi:hypothetical protein
MLDVDGVKKNIFPGAHDAVWGAFPWHDGAASPHSSQALAVSVFGTLAVHPARQGLRQCDGNYHEQTNPVNGRTARCALSAKGIRYWEHIPTYFNLAGDQDHKPCPFAGPAYQYMRNLLAAGEWARRRKKEQAAFGLVYVAGEGFPMSLEVADPGSEWGRFISLLRPNSPVVVKAISYQALLQAWRRCLPEDLVLADLEDWVDGKTVALDKLARREIRHV